MRVCRYVVEVQHASSPMTLILKYPDRLFLAALAVSVPEVSETPAPTYAWTVSQYGRCKKFGRLLPTTTMLHPMSTDAGWRGYPAVQLPVQQTGK